MNILITGSTGYLGKRVSLSFSKIPGLKLFAFCKTQSANKIPEYFEKNILFSENYTSYTDFLIDNQIDCILHIATEYGRAPNSLRNVIDTNLQMPLCLLDSAANAKVSFFLNTSSKLDKYVSPYSMAKCQFEEWLILYRKKIKFINLKLEHFYGPNEQDYKFISHLYNLLSSGAESIALTNGEQFRDFIYIDDVVSAYETIIRAIGHLPNSGLTSIEIGTGKGIHVRDLVLKLKSLIPACNTRLDFGSIPYRDNEVMHSVADITEIKSLGWRPVYSIENGLERVVNHE